MSVDHERFRAVYDDNFVALTGYALRRTDTAEDAADVVAETFLVAWRRIGDVPDGDRARLWLYGVARRVLANQIRGASRRRLLGKRLAAQAARVVPPPDVDEPDATGIGQAFRRLPDTDRELLLLAGWEDLDAAQIGQVLGCTAGTARVRLHRARTRLARELDAEGVQRPGDAGHDTARRAPSRPGMKESL